MFTLVLFLIGVTQVLFRCVRSGEVAAGTKAMQIRKSSGALSFLPPGFLRFFRVELKYYAAFLIRLDHFFTFEAPTYWYSRSRATCVEFTSWYRADHRACYFLCRTKTSPNFIYRED
jgi:hypothetical protein